MAIVAVSGCEVSEVNINAGGGSSTPIVHREKGTPTPTTLPSATASTEADYYKGVVNSDYDTLQKDIKAVSGLIGSVSAWNDTKDYSIKMKDLEKEMNDLLGDNTEYLKHVSNYKSWLNSSSPEYAAVEAQKNEVYTQFRT